MPGLEPTIFMVSLWHSTSVPHVACTHTMKLNILGAKYLSSFYSACLLILHSTRWLTMCVRILSNGSIQRWASTLANRSNARHRSKIRAPPGPLPPDVCIQSVGICVARGAGSDSQLAGVSGCHIFVPAPHAPHPKGLGQRSKVVILPTTGSIIKLKAEMVATTCFGMPTNQIL